MVASVATTTATLGIMATPFGRLQFFGATGDLGGNTIHVRKGLISTTVTVAWREAGNHENGYEN